MCKTTLRIDLTISDLRDLEMETMKKMKTIFTALVYTLAEK